MSDSRETLTSNEVREHLISRNMNVDFYEGVSVTEGLAVFPLRDFSGKMVGYQNYRPFSDRNHKNPQEARYFTYLPKKVFGYFGLESLYFSRIVYLVEGVFKAATLHHLGLTSIALMGSETTNHKAQIGLLNRPIVAIGDNDAAGRKFASAFKGIVSPIDLDEMTAVQLWEFIHENH